MKTKAHPSMPVLRSIVRYLLLHTFRVRVLHEHPLPPGNYIISSNHLNWIDPILVTMAWPKPNTLMYIGPRDTVTNTGWKKWLIGGMPEMVLTPQRSGWLGKEAYKKVLDGLNQGSCLLIFPEGDAFPNEGKVMPYMNGVAHFAMKSGKPVVPIGLCGTADLYYHKELLLRVGLPIDIPQSSQPDKKLLEDTLAYIRESTCRLVDGYTDPIVASKPMHWLTHLM